MRSAAQLTEYGKYERDWGEFPALGRMLGAKQIPDCLGSSVSDSAIDRLDRLIKISFLIRENADQLRSPELEGQAFNALAQDLAHLAGALECAAQQFHAESEEVANALRTLIDHREEMGP